MKKILNFGLSNKNFNRFYNNRDFYGIFDVFQGFFAKSAGCGFSGFQGYGIFALGIRIFLQFFGFSFPGFGIFEYPDDLFFALGIFIPGIFDFFNLGILYLRIEIFCNFGLLILEIRDFPGVPGVPEIFSSSFGIFISRTWVFQFRDYDT